jgi:hypothetical protein
MFWSKKKRHAAKNAAETEAGTELSPRVVSATVDDVKRIIREFEQHLPKGINRTVLIGQDNEINFQLLAPVMGGIPQERYYMSRETFEIFQEEDKHIAIWLDVVQKAVDDYITEEKDIPVLPGDNRKKISYTLLQNNYYLKEKPPLDFYLTDLEDMISHVPQE